MEYALICSQISNPEESERLAAAAEALHVPPEVDMTELSRALIAQLRIETSLVVREAIVFALQRCLAPNASSDLFALFQEDDAFLRNAAMVIFGKGDDMTVAFLMEQVVTSNREVRKLILDALVQIATPAAIQGIRMALYDPAPNVRISAADYLGRLNDADSVDMLLEMFCNDREPMLRMAILSGVASMTAPAAVRKLMEFQKNLGLDENDETLFLPILLRFAGRVGDTDCLARLLARVRSLPLYAEDIVQAFQNILELKLGESPRAIVLSEALSAIARDESIREHLRFSALTTLARLGCPLQVATPEAFAASFQEKDFRDEVPALCAIKA